MANHTERPKESTNLVHRAAMEAVQRRKNGVTGAQVVNLARKYTVHAIRTIAELMDGRAGKIKVLDKNGVLVEVDVEVPASVRAKCAEILIERGYGKAPQAIMIGTDNGLIPEAQRHVPVAEKILMIQAAREQGTETITLEASQQSEAVVADVVDDNGEIIQEGEAPRGPEETVVPAEPELASVEDMI